MRTRILLASFLVGIMLISASVPSKSYTKSIAGDPIGLAFGVFNATYEFQTGPQNSMTIFGNIMFPSGWTAFGVGASYRWYIVKEKHKKIIEGFGFGPKAMANFWESTANTGGISFSVGGEATYKWVFGNFAVEPIFSIIMPLGNKYGYGGMYYGLGVNLGYAW